MENIRNKKTPRRTKSCSLHFWNGGDHSIISFTKYASWLQTKTMQCFRSEAGVDPTVWPDMDVVTEIPN